MKPELQEQLMAKYPKIFRQKDLSCRESCMCWGLECPDSWYALLDELCEQIQHHVDDSGLLQVEASQVKEKFGTLRFYTDGGNDAAIEAFIALAENRSRAVCAGCGSLNDVQATKGWIAYLCDNCRTCKVV